MTDALDELARAAQNRPVPQQRVEVPEYPGITRGARMIQQWGMICTILGVIVFVSGTAMVCWILFHSTGTESTNYKIQTAIAWLVCLIGSIALFVWGTMLRLYAELCRAQRDIAINTFMLRFRR